MSNLKSAPLFEKVKARVVAAAADKDASRENHYVYLLNVTDGRKIVYQLTIDLKQLQAYDGPYSGCPDVTITVDDETLHNLANGTVSKEDALSNGSLVYEGNEKAIQFIPLFGKKLSS